MAAEETALTNQSYFKILNRNLLLECDKCVDKRTKKHCETLYGNSVTDVCFSAIMISTSRFSFWFPLCVSLKLSSTHILHKIRGNGLSLSVNGSFSNYDNVQPGTSRSTLDDNKQTHHIEFTENVSVSENEKYVL